MNQADNVAGNASTGPPVESKFPPILRAMALGVLVLILWSIDKFAVGRLPMGSAWRYIIGGVIISVGLGTVISVTDRFSNRNS
jgi:hypothetical protein